ncbi:MAG: DUF6132 family protein [Ignavibacteria bacterium]
MNKFLSNKYLKFALFGIIGSITGYAYYYFWGCKNGCPLSSNWYITTGYGMISGIILAMPSKKRNIDDSINNNSV